MEYRINRRTGDRISIIGLGSSSISQVNEKEGVETLKIAFDNGINYFDLAAGDAKVLNIMVKLLKVLGTK